MTINEINQSFDELNLIGTDFLTILTAICLAVFISIYLYKKDNMLLALILSFFIVVATFIIPSLIIQKQSEEKIEVWTDAIKKEHIEKLEREEVRIMYLTILKEDIINSDKEFHFDKYEDLVKNVRISYMKDGYPTEEIVKAIVVRKEGIMNDIFEFSTIETNLPSNNERIIFKKGYYNPIIYVADDSYIDKKTYTEFSNVNDGLENQISETINENLTIKALKIFQ
jgi:hypothetical protein